MMSLIQTRRSVLITGYNISICLPSSPGAKTATDNSTSDVHRVALDMHLHGNFTPKVLFQKARYFIANTKRLAGLHVIATARKKDTIKDLAENGMSTVSLEITSSESISAAKKEVEALTGGKLDILVNNAGRNCTMPGLDVPLDDARACFDTNFFGLIAITQQFIPLLLASKGLIVNIGSVAGVMPYVFGSVYNASKAAVHSYSDTLRLELEPYDVRVMVVITGGVQSNIARTHQTLPEGSLYLPLLEEFERRQKHSQDGAMSNEDYARGVVTQALKTSPKKRVWRGNKVWLVWFVKTFLGSWAFDWTMLRMFGLHKLRALVMAKAKRV